MILRRLILLAYVLIPLACAHEPVPSVAGDPVATPQACIEMMARDPKAKC